MKFRNTKTGAIINISSAIGGGDWVPADGKEVQPAAKVEPTKPAEPTPSKSEMKNVDVGGVTVKQIKQELDAMGISYPAIAKKQELYDLMMRK